MDATKKFKVLTNNFVNHFWHKPVSIRFNSLIFERALKNRA